jgi:hypothetical protein
LNLLDGIDEQNASKKLNLIFHLPYTIKGDALQARASARINSIEDQLENSPHGVACVDASEKITQLNRSIDNDLLPQIKYLTEELYLQLGMTKAIVDGTAGEKELLNYYTRTIEPILNSITNEFARKYLTKTARTQGQNIMYFRDPFKLVPVEQLANIADKFSRNEIFTPNEIRAIVGYQPTNDPKADELRNRNMPQQDPQEQYGIPQDTKTNIQQNIIDLNAYGDQYK